MQVLGCLVLGNLGLEFGVSEACEGVASDP